MTKRPNEKNERIKRAYMTFRKHSEQVSDKTLDREIAALERFDVWNERKDFANFHIDWAVGFRAHLDQAKGQTGIPLAKSTTRAIMATMRAFALWLSQQDGFRRRIKAVDANYFRLSLRDEAEARAAPERAAPSVRQAKHALNAMPEDTPRQMRDKAIFSILCLTGIRVAALTSLKVKHVDLIDKSVNQNPREVATKFGRQIDTFFGKDFEEAEAALANWMTYLEEVELYCPDDPLFPVTALTTYSGSGFTTNGFARAHWKTTEPVRKIVNTAFHTVGLQPFGPHAFRHMLARHAAKTCTSISELVEVSQNLGHEDVMMTVRRYGQVSREDQRRLITGQGNET